MPCNIYSGAGCGDKAVHIGRIATKAAVLRFERAPRLNNMEALLLAAGTRRGASQPA
jgi:hypothetical protein